MIFRLCKLSLYISVGLASQKGFGRELFAGPGNEFEAFVRGCMQARKTREECHRMLPGEGKIGPSQSNIDAARAGLIAAYSSAETDKAKAYWAQKIQVLNQEHPQQTQSVSLIGESSLPTN